LHRFPFIHRGFRGVWGCPWRVAAGIAAVAISKRRANARGTPRPADASPITTTATLELWAAVDGTGMLVGADSIRDPASIRGTIDDHPTTATLGRHPVSASGTAQLWAPLRLQRVALWADKSRVRTVTSSVDDFVNIYVDQMNT
jgi:hypothetical protein